MSSKNYNLFLNPKAQDALRSFRQRPYAWDPNQTSETEAFRDRMQQRYRFPNTQPKESKPAYVPHILDHRAEAAKVGYEKPAPIAVQSPLTWQADVLKWLFIFLGMLILLFLSIALSSVFGGIVELVLIFLTGWFCLEKMRIFLNSDDEFEIE